MRHLLILAFVLMLTASLAFAQAGSIGIFADQTGSSCNVVDAAAGLCEYYVVHVLHGGATAGEFSAPVPICLGAGFLSDGTVFSVNIGNSQDGISIGYGACRPAPTHILTLKFFCQATTSDCCYYKVLPHPETASGMIEGVDCNFVATFPTGGEAIVNSVAETCDCDVPNQDTTWGNVKALFGN